MIKILQNHRIFLYYLKKGKNHRVEEGKLPTFRQHFVEKHIKTDNCGLAQIQPCNSVLKPFFAEKLSFFDTYYDSLKHPNLLGNNPMVGATVAVAVAVQEAMTK